MHWRSISSKIFSAMLLSLNLRTRFMLIVAWSGPFSVSLSPRNHLNAMFSFTACAILTSDLMSYRYPSNSILNSISGSIAGRPLSGLYRSLHMSWINEKSTAASTFRRKWSWETNSSNKTISYSFCCCVFRSLNMFCTSPYFSLSLYFIYSTFSPFSPFG